MFIFNLTASLERMRKEKMQQVASTERHARFRCNAGRNLASSPRSACLLLTTLAHLFLLFINIATAIDPGEEAPKWKTLFGVALTSRYTSVRVRAPTSERRLVLCRHVCASNAMCRRYGVSYVPSRFSDEAECRLPLPPWRQEKGLACANARLETTVDDISLCHRLCGVNCTRYSTRPVASALDEQGDAVFALRVNCSVPTNDDDDACAQRIDDATLHSIDTRWLRNALRMKPLQHRFQHLYNTDTAVVSNLRSAFENALSMMASSEVVRRGGPAQPIVHPTTARALVNPPVSSAYKIAIVATALLFLGALGVSTCYTSGWFDGCCRQCQRLVGVASPSGAHFSTRIIDKNSGRSTRAPVKI